MTRLNSAKDLIDQLEAECGLLIAGNYAAVLDGLGDKRSFIEQAVSGFNDRTERLAVRSAARRQQRLLRAALAGLSAARTHLIGASAPAPVRSYSKNGAMRAPEANSRTTLKKV